MTTDRFLFDAVFGAGSSGASPEERAATSKNQFVRSQHQISEYRTGATGRIINALEALRMIGWEKMQSLADQPAVPIIIKSDEPYQSIIRQLNNLGLNLNDVAGKVRWSDEVKKKFDNRQQIPFRDLERLARAIGLESDKLGTTIDAGADVETGVRLRTYRKSDPSRFTTTTVVGLAEAAWTIQKQFELARLVGSGDDSKARRRGFEPSTEYGGPLVKTYQEGYRLARKTRQLLGMTAEVPIDSIKDLVEVKLGIPVVQLEIHQQLAGATVSSEANRGIAINLNGDNKNPLVRRMTMAHELGHLLWDPDQKLQRLVVDRYDAIIGDDVATASQLDAVERRANAFAIEFLAPGDAILEYFKQAGGGLAGLKKVIQMFGISRTAATNHLMNASHNEIDLSNERFVTVPDAEWEARESVAVPLFDPQTVPVSRRGRFAYYVMKAVEKGLISDDTAASLYQCGAADLQRALKSTRSYIGT